MDGAQIRFKEKDKIIITMMNGRVIPGYFLRGPQTDYNYWTLQMDEDGSIIACNTLAVESIMRPSSKMLSAVIEMQEKLKEKEDGSDENGQQ